MNIVRIKGPEAIVASLGDIFDLIIIENSGEMLDSGEVQLSGYASDRAISEIETRGTTVEVLFDNDSLEARDIALQSLIEGEEPIV